MTDNFQPDDRVVYTGAYHDALGGILNKGDELTIVTRSGVERRLTKGDVVFVNRGKPGQQKMACYAGDLSLAVDEPIIEEDWS